MPQKLRKKRKSTLTRTRILNETRRLEKSEKLNPQDNTESPAQVLCNFDWTDSSLEPDAKRAVETLAVKFQDKFARHRLNISFNTEFNVKLTPLEGRIAYRQSLQAPNKLKNGLLVQQAVLHKHSIATNLTPNKYASPIVSQRKPNGKLRKLFDLQILNKHIADDYVNDNRPVRTISNSAQHMVEKNFFCKLDCSQTFNCLQMVDQQSVDVLAFNFPSKIFAYRR